jgi:hypothetical protein
MIRSAGIPAVTAAATPAKFVGHLGHHIAIGRLGIHRF